MSVTPSKTTMPSETAFAETAMRSLAPARTIPPAGPSAMETVHGLVLPWSAPEIAAPIVFVVCAVATVKGTMVAEAHTMGSIL